MEKESHFDD
jgi:hypothetical protein